MLSGAGRVGRGEPLCDAGYRSSQNTGSHGMCSLYGCSATQDFSGDWRTPPQTRTYTCNLSRFPSRINKQHSACCARPGTPAAQSGWDVRRAVTLALPGTALSGRAVSLWKCLFLAGMAVAPVPACGVFQAAECGVAPSLRGGAGEGSERICACSKRILPCAGAHCDEA